MRTGGTFKMRAVVDVSDITKQLDKLTKAMRNKILRKIVGEGGKVLLKVAKAALSGYGGGLTRKSLGRKVKVYRQSGIAVCIVGPRTKMRKQIGTVTRGPNKGKPKFTDPAKIAHLIEKGTGERVGKTGKRSGAMPAHPFMRPAVQQSGPIRAAMVEAGQQGIADALGR